MLFCIKYCCNILYPCSPCNPWFIPIFPFRFMVFVKSFPGHRFWLVRMADCLGDGRHAAAAWSASHLPATDEYPVPAPKQNDRRLVSAVDFSPQKKCFSRSCEGKGCQARERRRRRTITVVRLKASSAHVEGSGTVAVNVSVPSSSNWAL